ncbi:hypothetical protein PSACC_00121 [Paramicrosporidium saccamoebae]|uniref:Superkiller protein 3 n=1 Tax=Paramicrosporidium saccamoebae TaxID=1246581 RepID=A0A2H9TQQ5_9FUNG|nr:hypothetical protein PSACC_00121 [Paramicrosporidium saccamoebae]
MSSVKSLCKAAREALDRGDAATALRICETGLNEPHYMLLVFKALSLQQLGQTDDALRTYREAIDCEEGPLAWQTLRKMFKDDTAKYLDYTKRLLKAHNGAGQLDACLPLLQWLRKEGANADQAKNANVDSAENTTVGRADNAHVDQTDNTVVDQTRYLDEEISIRERLEDARISKEIEVRRYRLGAEPLVILKEIVKNEVYLESPLEVLYEEKLFMGRNVGIADKLMDRMLRKIPKIKEKNTKKLLDLAKEYSADSKSAQIILIDMLDHKNVLVLGEFGPYEDLQAASDEKNVEELAAKRPSSLFSSLFCVGYFWKHRELANTQKWINNTRRLAAKLETDYNVNTPMMKKQLDRLEALVFAKDGRFYDAIPLLNTSLGENPEDFEIIESMIDCYTALHSYQEAISLYHRLLADRADDVKLLSDLGWHYFLDRDYSQARNFLHQAQRLGEDATILTRLGRVYWDEDESNRKDRNICLAYFLSAAKSNPNGFEAFLFLGKYYFDVEKDVIRAEKCFTKSLSLNSDCMETALELALIWISAANRHPSLRDKLHKVIRVLEPFTGEYYRNSKMWMYLGMAFSGVDKWPQSTTAFQNALKGERPNELRCLLGLAEGYRRQKRYMAAGKAYKRVLELDPSNKTAIVGLASVDTDTGEYESALERLAELEDAIVQLEQVRVGYLKAAELINNACIKEAISDIETCLQQCLQVFQSHELKGKRLCWKMLSDTCLLMIRVRMAPELKELESTCARLLETVSIEFEGNEIWNGILKALSSDSLISTVVKISCLCQINLIVESDDAAIVSGAWTDLAVVLLRSATTPNRELLEIVKDCATQATEESMEAGIAWLILGIAHFRCDDYGMAQHCFLKAVNRNVSSAWLGLAHLYSSLGDDDLASRAIEIVKVSDENAPAWLYEAFQARNTARVGPLLGQAIDASSAVDASLCMLWVAKGEHDGTAEDLCKLRMSLMRRLAFCPTDAVAKDALCKLEPVKKPHDSSIMALVTDNRLSTNPPACCDVPGDTCDALWLKSYISYQQNDPATAMSTQFNGSLFTPGKWSDILFWHDQTHLGIEHLKLRVTPELAERLPGEAGAILSVWTDVPEEVQRPLLQTKRFLADFEKRFVGDARIVS